MKEWKEFKNVCFLFSLAYFRNMGSFIFFASYFS